MDYKTEITKEMIEEAKRAYADQYCPKRDEYWWMRSTDFENGALWLLGKIIDDKDHQLEK